MPISTSKHSTQICGQDLAVQEILQSGEWSLENTRLEYNDEGVHLRAVLCRNSSNNPLELLRGQLAKAEKLGGESRVVSVTWENTDGGRERCTIVWSNAWCASIGRTTETER